MRNKNWESRRRMTMKESQTQSCSRLTSFPIVNVQTQVLACLLAWLTWLGACNGYGETRTPGPTRNSSSLLAHLFSFFYIYYIYIVVYHTTMMVERQDSRGYLLARKALVRIAGTVRSALNFPCTINVYRFTPQFLTTSYTNPLTNWLEQCSR